MCPKRTKRSAMNERQGSMTTENALEMRCARSMWVPMGLVAPSCEQATQPSQARHTPVHTPPRTKLGQAAWPWDGDGGGADGMGPSHPC